MCPDEPQDHEPDAELIREVYARFGAAYYFSEVLHRGLSNAYVIAPFEGRDGVTGPRVDERMANAFSLTLGQLIESLRPWLSAHLLERLGAAARRRNYLAHHFWFEKAHLMFSDGDLAGLAHELEEHRAFFDEVSAEADAHFQPLAERLGITAERVQDAMLAMAADGEWEGFPNAQRRLRKREIVVRAWDIAIADRASTLILETDDGALWQLCDEGLGWTRYTAPEPHWQPSAIVMRHLPATLDPRPGAPGSWNYELILRSARLRVRLHPTVQNTYTWSVVGSTV